MRAGGNCDYHGCCKFAIFHGRMFRYNSSNRWPKQNPASAISRRAGDQKLIIDLVWSKEKERKVNFRTRFFLMLANEFLAFEHSPLFFVDIIIHCSLLRTCRVRVEEKEEFLVYTVLWTLTCHPYLESATALSDNFT